MSKEEKTPPNQISLELPEEIAEGSYANLVMIAHSHSEFVLDFIRIMPGVPKAKVKSRVVVTPEHARRFLEALKENVAKYERSFGKISADKETRNIPIHFGGTVGEA